ncbi:MAG: HAD family hydrolase [Nocardioides sp.]
MTDPVIDAVVFDYGGVLTTPVADSITAWLEADGIRPDSLSAALKEWLGRNAEDGTPIHRLETGELSAQEFGALLAARLTTFDGTPVEPTGVLRRLFAAMGADERMYELVADLRAAGVRTALLSNSWGNTYPRERLTALMDVVVISGEVGLRKPGPEIYRMTLERLGITDPATAVFIDDAGPNIEGAEAIGMRGLLHTDAATTRTALAALIPDLSPTSEASA